MRRDMHRQKDPLEKEGVIGAFNHVFFPIQRLLETELSDVYEPAAVDGRYTHIGSSGSAGAVIYEDRFLYSHHATDPAYDSNRNRYWNDSELELTLARGTSVELYGLRICRQAAENGKIKYALVLSDGTKTSGMVLTE